MVADARRRVFAGRGGGTIKLRRAYGKGIRPPPPSARQPIATLRFRQSGNPGLEPETQSGVEAASNGSPAIAPWFRDWLHAGRQGAHPAGHPGSAHHPVPERGEIANRGIEIEAQAARQPSRERHAELDRQPRSRVGADVFRRPRSGDRVPEVPSSSGSASVGAGT